MSMISTKEIRKRKFNEERRKIKKKGIINKTIAGEGYQIRRIKKNKAKKKNKKK